MEMKRRHPSEDAALPVINEEDWDWIEEQITIHTRCIECGCYTGTDQRCPSCGMKQGR